MLTTWPRDSLWSHSEPTQAPTSQHTRATGTATACHLRNTKAGKAGSLCPAPQCGRGTRPPRGGPASSQRPPAPHTRAGRRAALGRERHHVSAPLLAPPALQGEFSQPESGRAACSGRSQHSQSLFRAIKAPPVSSFTSEHQGRALAKRRRNGNKTIMRASPSTRGGPRGGPGRRPPRQLKSSFHHRGQAGRLRRRDRGPRGARGPHGLAGPRRGGMGDSQ